MTTAIASLEALAHDTRLGVLRLLVRAGPDGLSAGEIAAALAARQNTLSNHLHKLQHANIVSSNRDGRHIIYAVNFDAIRALIVYLLEDCCAGDAAVCKPVAASINH